MRILQTNAIVAALLSTSLVVASAVPAFAKPPAAKTNNGNSANANNGNSGTGGANPASHGNKKCPDDNGKAQHSPTKSQGNACGQFGNTGQPPGV